MELRLASVWCMPYTRRSLLPNPLDLARATESRFMLVLGQTTVDPYLARQRFPSITCAGCPPWLEALPCTKQEGRCCPRVCGIARSG